MVKPPVLAPFDPNLPTAVQTDASRLKGLGFALMQKHGESWRLVQCGSRFLDSAESGYAMIELEMLAIYWAIAKKCRLYLLGMPKFQVITDHKPLIPIINRYTLDMIDNIRVQKMKENLMPYCFEAQWQKGSEHYIPDALSRAPIADPVPDDLLPKGFEEEVIASVRMVASNLVDEEGSLLDLNLEKVKAAAASDEDYQRLKVLVANGFPSSSDKLVTATKAYWSVRDELSLFDGLILKGCQLVIPKAMRKDVLSHLHSSHQGIERTKRRARETVYWPGFSSDVTNTVQACEPCQLHLPSLQKETFMHDPLPTKPFIDMSADLFSSGGYNYLVLVDRYSGWPTVHCWKNMPSSQQVIDAIIQDFAIYGVPLRVRTDGGPQFTASTFKNFLEEWNVQTGFSTPHYPQSNGHAEAAVKAMKALVIKTECRGDLSNPAFMEGLLEWRNTPKAHGCSPAQLVFGHSLRSKVPTVVARPLSAPTASNATGPSVESRPQFARLGHSEAVLDLKSKEKNRYNMHANDLSPMGTGTKVRIQDSISKLWDKVGTVIRCGKNRDYEIRLDNGRVYWRNRLFVRPYHEPVPPGKGGERKKVTFADSSPQQPRRSSRARKAPDRFGQISNA